MQINLSEQCVNELLNQLGWKFLRDDFKEVLISHYLEENAIHINDEDLECFVDDVYEKFQEYHNYETSWDDALQQAMEDLISHGDYALYDCDHCGEKVILRGDDEECYTDIDGYRYCKKCFDYKFAHCQKCGRTVSKLDDAIEAHGHYYCTKCASELLSHLVEPDIKTEAQE